jgi:hypothetical protein
MADTQNDKHASYTKMAWVIYSVLAMIVVAVLVLVVAQDLQEELFYGMMATAVSYVFRPTDKFMNGLIFKYTGVAAPAKPEVAEPAKPEAAEPTKPE